MGERMGPPGKLKIGLLDWTVEVRQDMVVDGYYGRSNFGEQRIVLSEKVSETRRLWVLLHEVFHVLLAEVQMNEALSEKQLETFLDLLSQGLLVALRENPELLEYLRGALEGVRS